jgi:GT2 family glycosyltransferase
MKKVLVIVVAYNGMRWLKRCLDSVYDQADVYVFDNDSTDGSADFVASGYPSVKLVRSAENLGFSKPNNLGFEYAIRKGYEYVYLLNQDAWLEAGALEKLVAASEAHPEYGVLSPMQYQDGYEKLDKQFEKLFRNAEGGVMEVPRVMAAHWLVPVRVIEKIGPFEEKLFPFYGQDDEWCHRLHFFGLKVGVVPEARAVHDRALRPESKEKLVHRNFYTGSLVRLCQHNRPLFQKFLFVILFTLVKAVKYCSVLPFKYFGQIVKDLPAVKELRSRVRARAHSAR